MSAALLAGAGIALGLDQLTKRLVRTRLAEGETLRLGPVRIHRRTNVRRRPLLVTLAVATIAMLALVALGPFFRADVARLGLGLALGGAIGNVLGARRDGGVLDFVDLRVWPLFNVADAAIVLGAALALWRIR